jgi:hypothetical protein
MSLPSRDKIYGNCSVLHPDGTLMFRCDEDRIDWYLSRDLAVLVSEEPPVIQLTFTPKGKGHIGEPFYLSEKSNSCVVCGATENLTRHHAVPHCYRRHFPEHLKSRSSHDVLPCCIECHEKYEVEAQKLKKELATKYGLPINGGGRVDDSPARDYHRAKSSANALMRYADKIPVERQRFLRRYVSVYLNKEVTDEDIIQLAMIPSRRGREDLFSHGKGVVEKLEDYEEFTVMWRKHFVATMKPRFLHEHWDVNHRIQSSWAKNQNEGGIKVLVATWTARFAGWNPLQMLRKLF